MLDTQGEANTGAEAVTGSPAREDFRTSVRRWAGCHVVFEASMNWHWLLRFWRKLPSERILLANPFQDADHSRGRSKTDKVDARILADLLRGRLVSSVHIAGRETRQIMEVLRQRCFRHSEPSLHTGWSTETRIRYGLSPQWTLFFHIEGYAMPRNCGQRGVSQQHTTIIPDINDIGISSPRSAT